MGEAQQLAADSDESDTVSLFGLRIARLTLNEAVDTLLAWINDRRRCRYVVTPNVNHVVMLQSHGAMQAAYRDAGLVVADGWPLVSASRMLGQPLPERVAGSDLVPRLFASAGRVSNLRVYFLGAAPGVAQRAANKVQERWPNVVVCGCSSPPRNFEADPELNDEIIRSINAAEPHLLVVGLGAPRQEIWLRRFAPLLNVPVAIAGGATIDFLAGAQTRAPVWVQRLKLEWLFRLISDPKRLAGRYARDAFLFPKLLVAEWNRIGRAGRALSAKN